MRNLCWLRGDQHVAQRRIPALVLGFHVGSACDERFDGRVVALDGRVVQRSKPIPAGLWISAGSEEQVYCHDISRVGGLEQSGRAVCLFRIGIGAAVEKQR